MHELDIGQMMLGLKQRVEQRDDALFSRYHISKPADFIRYYQRLSVILVQSLHEQGSNRSLLWWQNHDARYALPSKVANRLRSLITTDTSQPFTANLLKDSNED
jgi:ribose 1,5-bisphosphokinase PhnN